MAQRIVILGAGGYTAGLIRQNLTLAHIEAVLFSRREDAAQGIRALDIQDTAQVEASIQKGDIVVNCVGPFNLYSRALTEQLAQKSVTVLDISGEQAFVSFSYNTLEATAKKYGSLLLHACAFESFLAAMLAERCCQKGVFYEEINSYYWFENGSPSPGTALTMRLANHYETQAYENGAWVPKAPQSGSRPFHFPRNPELSQAVFVPYPEIEFFPRTYQTKNAASYFAMSEGEAGMFKSAGGGPKREIADILKKHQQRQPVGQGEAQRKTQGVGVAVEAKAVGGMATTAWLTGVDPYGLTAAIISWSCARLLEQKERPSGVLSPSQAFSSELFFKDLLAWQGFEIQTG